METIEKIALAVTGIEFVGALSLALFFKKAIDEKVQNEYGCKNSKEFFKKCENHEIKFKKRFEN